MIVGPTSEGETRDVEVSMEADHTLLTGRLLDEHGKPLAKQTFDWRRMLDDDQSIVASGRDKLATDGDGRFLWTLRRSAQATGPSTHRTGFLCEQSSSKVRRQATVHFGMEYTNALSNLGDIVMRPGGPLAAGRIVDENGAPVPNATVELRMTNSAGATSAPTFDPAVSDADGTFAIFGPCLTLAFILHIEGPLIARPRDVPFSCSNATSEVVVKIDARGGLEGTARIDHDAATDELLVSFTPDGKSVDDRSYAATRRVGDRIYFVFTGENPGSGAVGFHADGDDVVGVLSVPRITIAPGVIGRAHELADVDLRGKLRKANLVAPNAETIEFTILDSRGRAIPRGVIAGRSHDGDRGDLITFGNGRARISPALLVDQVSLEIWAPNCRVAVLTPPFTSRRVALDSEFEVEFEFDVPPRWKEAKLTLIGYVSMRDVDPPQFQPVAFDRMQPFQFDARGRGNAGLPCAGAFSVYLVIRRAVPGEDDDDYGVGMVDEDFVVRETDGRQVVELVLDPESVKQCNEDLGLK